MNYIIISLQRLLGVKDSQALPEAFADDGVIVRDQDPYLRCTPFLFGRGNASVARRNEK